MVIGIGMMVVMTIEVFLVFFVGIVPDGFYEDFQYRVQMGNEDKESDEEDGEYGDGENLEPRDGDVREEPRYDERKYDKDNRRDECPDIDQEKREIEMERDAQIAQCHTNRETQCLECFLVLEDYKKSSVREEYVHEKRESEIDGHEDADAHEIIFSEYTQ